METKLISADGARTLAKDADYREAPDGDHHGSAAALQDAAGDEDMDVAGDTTEERPQGEDADGRGEDAAGAEAVRHPAADGNEDGEREGVAGQHRLHAERRDAEGRGDGGDGGVEDGGVERLHEEGDGDEPRQQAPHCG